MSLGDAVQATPEALELPVFVGSNYQGFLACEAGLSIKPGARAPGMCGFQIQARGAGARLGN